MGSFVDTVTQAWEHISAQTAPPTARQFAVAVVVGALLVLWRRTWRRVTKILTVAHEGGHALAAVITRRSVLGVRIHTDGSGVTHTHGRSRGFGSALVTFAGYPFPGVAGAALIVGSTSQYARLVAAAVAIASLMLLWTTRNVHGWLVIGSIVLAAGTAAWYLDGASTAIALAVLGSTLVFGSVRDLFGERRQRRAGGTGSDVWVLARRSALPVGAWWAVMLATVLGSAALAWQQVAGTYAWA